MNKQLSDLRTRLNNWDGDDPVEIANIVTSVIDVLSHIDAQLVELSARTTKLDCNIAGRVTQLERKGRRYGGIK